MLMINGDLIEKGLKEMLGYKSYIVVTDKDDNIVCASYDLDACEQIIDMYLKKNNYNTVELNFEKKKLRGKENQMYLIPYKIVLLDKQVVLYKDVKALANQNKIKDFKDGFPKYGINQYETV